MVKIALNNGWVLSVDPASNLCGVSLWYDTNYVSSKLLASKHNKDPFTVRMQGIASQLSEFLDEHVKDDVVKTVIFEGVRSALLTISCGALVVNPRIKAQFNPATHLVHSTTWKSWAKRHGASGPLKDVKGVKALKETGFDVEKHKIESDDVADSIMIYLAWLEKHGI